MTWNTRDWLQLPTRYPYPFGLSQVLLNPQNRLFNTVALQAFKVVILGDASLAGAYAQFHRQPSRRCWIQRPMT